MGKCIAPALVGIRTKTMKQFEFEKAHVNEQGELCLKIRNIPMARQFCLTMRDRMYTAELKEYREHRSLDANAYFWVLCDKLAEATGIPKTEIYRQSIREIGGNTQTVCVPTKGADKLVSNWGHNGLGWIADTTESKLPGCTNVILYYGSSTYDKSQMARLIDNIVQDCKAVGIETMTPAQLDALKEEWGR